MTAKRRCAELLRAKSLTLLPPGWHADGRGLYLLVTSTGARRWILRTLIKGGRRCEIGLGSLYDVDIDEARDKASELRRAARMGRDPIVERRARLAAVMTYRQTFDVLIGIKGRSLSNAKHLAQWRSTMETYVFPRIGDRPVSEIASGEVLAVLEPIWHDKPETAKRVLQRMSAVFDSAILRNWRERASPCIGVAQALGGTSHRVVRHHRALPYVRVPAFLTMLRHSQARPETKLAFEWLILTATRSGETRRAVWSEIDEARALWVIPSHRMKGSQQRRKEHRVPLSPRCLEILAAARALRLGSELVFPNRQTGKALSDMVFIKLLRDLGLGGEATAHGFRSSFRDWATEIDKVREVVAEAVLAHSVRDKTEGAYRRTTYLGERRELMERWATFLQRKPMNEVGFSHSRQPDQTDHVHFLRPFERP
jgi:integrase